MDKPAQVDHPVHELVRGRWSPRAFAVQPIAQEQLRSLLEAARWAPSSRNSQPWRFLVARRDEPAEFARMLGCLVPGNQRWAGAAAVLLIAVATLIDQKGLPLAHALYDTGQAVAWLSAEATARGIRVHQMGGFDPDRVRDVFSVPDGSRPVAIIALGYPGDPRVLDENLRRQELAPRTRHPQSELVFKDRWGVPA
jgi:nitroreductase